MKQRNSLLPANASDLERKLEQALKLDLPCDIAKLWHPDVCPSEFLPALAKQYGSPYFDQDWDETTKRKIIKASFVTFKIRGTRKSLIDALAPFGKVLEINEWFNEQGAKTGTFSIRFALSNQGMNEDAYNQILRLIDEVRPVSRHLSALDINLVAWGAINTASTTFTSETLVVLPLPVTNINKNITPFIYAGADCAPTSIDVFPYH